MGAGWTIKLVCVVYVVYGRSVWIYMCGFMCLDSCRKANKFQKKFSGCGSVSYSLGRRVFFMQVVN